MTIVEAKKIWDIDRDWKGKHIPTGGEVHPDLVRFKGYWYCGFKETGRSRIIRSPDGEHWETVKLLEWEGAFVGRPYLSIAPEGALMINTWIRPLREEECRPIDRTERHPENRIVTPVKRIYATWLSLDGTSWTEATAHEATLGFSVTWHNGVCYGVDLEGSLHYSCDGKHWHLLTRNIFPEREQVLSWDPNDLGAAPGTRATACNETALYFDPHDDTAYALTRTNPVCVLIGTSVGPRYPKWSWREVRTDWNGDGRLVPARDVMGTQLGCPVIKRLSDGRIYGVGRTDASDETTNRSRVAAFWVDLENCVLTVFAKLDGYGGYSGVVEQDGLLWIACSNNTFPSFEVFLLKIKVPEPGQ